VNNKVNIKPVIGWREWVELPALGIRKIKAKIDTGARTSALDVTDCRLFVRQGEDWVAFTLRYGTGKNPREKTCEARVIEQREVKDSGGNVENRIVIATTARIGRHIEDIEISLTTRHGMKFRMLLGRTAIVDRFLVDISRSYLTTLD
jgi:hypothetical protein